MIACIALRLQNKLQKLLQEPVAEEIRVPRRVRYGEEEAYTWARKSHEIVKRQSP